MIVAVSAPHRGEAFDAARYGIDTLKATVPIWKQETWAGGADWALGARTVTEVGADGEPRVPARDAGRHRRSAPRVLLLRAREPKGEYRGIKSFQREMRALAPEGSRSGADGTDPPRTLDPLLPAASSPLGPVEETDTPAPEHQE